MNEKISGAAGDAPIGNFNQRETHLDGDFDAAYTGRNSPSGSHPEYDCVWLIALATFL